MRMRRCWKPCNDEILSREEEKKLRIPFWIELYCGLACGREISFRIIDDGWAVRARYNFRKRNFVVCVSNHTMQWWSLQYCKRDDDTDDCVFTFFCCCYFHIIFCRCWGMSTPHTSIRCDHGAYWRLSGARIPCTIVVFGISSNVSLFVVAVHEIDEEGLRQSVYCIRQPQHDT